MIKNNWYWSDWTPVAGQQFEYAFDDIGNRKSTKSGGDDRKEKVSVNGIDNFSGLDR